MCVGVVSEKAESANPAVLNVILSVVFLTFSLFEFEYGSWGENNNCVPNSDEAMELEFL